MNRQKPLLIQLAGAAASKKMHPATLGAVILTIVALNQITKKRG